VSAACEAATLIDGRRSVQGRLSHMQVPLVVGGGAVAQLRKCHLDQFLGDHAAQQSSGGVQLSPSYPTHLCTHARCQWQGGASSGAWRAERDCAASGVGVETWCRTSTTGSMSPKGPASGRIQISICPPTHGLSTPCVLTQVHVCCGDTATATDAENTPTKTNTKQWQGGGGGVTSVGPRPELPSNNAWYSARSKGTSVVGASAVPHPACLPCFARKFSAERSIRYLRREGSDI
jgi:hypothetical protein